MSSNSVLSSLLLIGLTACATAGTPQPSEDTLRIDGISGADDVVVMIDARTQAGPAGCTNDLVVRVTGVSSLGRNLLSAAGCNSEIAVFSSRHAMLLETPVSTWSDKSGDVHRPGLRPVIRVPVTVWIADRAAAAKAVDELNNANFLYAQNRVGVRFVPTYRDVSADPKAIEAIGKGIDVLPTGSRECRVDAVKGSAFHTPRTLNVYYVSASIAAGPFTGRNCAITRTPSECPGTQFGKGDGNVTYIGSEGNLATLAHELAHAFGLRPSVCGGHTEHVAGFAADNLMQGAGSPLRSHLSLGQVFRMNVQKDAWGGTMLIENGLRPGPGRECAPDKAGVQCPALGLDVPGRSPLPLASATREMLRRMLEARYDALEAQGRENPSFAMKSTRDGFVARYLD
jgi:hypothetical protein